MARLTWDEREQPLLEAIRDLEDDSAGQLQNRPIAEASGLSEEDTALGLQALLEAGYITGNDMRGYGPPGANLLGARLLPLGRVKVRQWPGEDASTALLEALDDALANTDDPGEQTIIRQARNGLRGLTGKVLTELAIGYARRVSHLD